MKHHRRLNGLLRRDGKIIFSPTENRAGRDPATWRETSRRRCRRTAAKYEGLFPYRRPRTPHTKIFRRTETSHSRPFRGGIPSPCAVSSRYIVSQAAHVSTRVLSISYILKCLADLSTRGKKKYRAPVSGGNLETSKGEARRIRWIIEYGDTRPIYFHFFHREVSDDIMAWTVTQDRS